jgi:hypothetical protein
MATSIKIYHTSCNYINFDVYIVRSLKLHTLPRLEFPGLESSAGADPVDQVLAFHFIDLDLAAIGVGVGPVDPTGDRAREISRWRLVVADSNGCHQQNDECGSGYRPGFTA